MHFHIDSGQTVRNCIFCGEKDLSKEHLFAKWIGGYSPNFKASEYTKTLNENPDFFGDQAIKTKSEYTAKRRPADMKLRIVCTACNTKWMSQIQNNCKPIIEPLIKGQWLELNYAQRTEIAAWVTMFIMVLEFQHPQTVAISQDERDQFSKSHQPFETWSIWMGRFNSINDNFAFRHRGIAIGSKSSPEISQKMNTQITTFGIGRIMFLGFSSSSELIATTPENINKYAHETSLIKIWPLSEIPMAFPMRSLLDGELSKIIETITYGLTGKNLPVNESF